MAKRTKKLVSIILKLCFTLLIMGVASFGWLSFNRQVNITNFKVSSASVDIEFTYRIYKFDEEIQAGRDATDDEDSLKLSTYDSIILSKNEYTPAIIKLDMTSNKVDMRSLKCRVICDDRSEDEYKLSDVIDVNVEYIDISSTDEAEIYDLAVQHFAQDSVRATRRSFYDGEQKLSVIEFDLSEYAEHVDIANNALTLYIEIDYDAEIIAGIDFAGFDPDAGFFGTSIIYTSDLEEILIYGGEL